MKNFEILILAAGKGTRMKTQKPKLLNKIKNQTILDRIIRKAQKLGANKINVMINKDYKYFIDRYKKVNFFFQNKILGTGHAVISFLKKKKTIKSNLVIMMGDAPSININSIQEVIKKLGNKSLVLLGAKLKKNHSNGMIQFKKKKIYKIKEFSFLNKYQKKNCLCNTGVIGIQKEYIKNFFLIKKNKIKKEYLLTDIVNIAFKKKIDIDLVLTKNSPLSFGINTLKDLEAHF